MSQKQVIYLASIIAAIFAIGITAGSLWSDHKIAKLERLAETEKQRAATLQVTAVEKEKAAEQFKAKAEYLETAIAEISAIAAKQNEELEKLQSNTNNRRDAAAHTRGVRSIESTAAELCTKLAELGHGCR